MPQYACPLELHPKLNPFKLIVSGYAYLVGTEEGHQRDGAELKQGLTPHGPNICLLLVCVHGFMTLFAVSVTQYNQHAVQTLVLFLAPCSLSFADPSH